MRRRAQTVHFARCFACIEQLGCATSRYWGLNGLSTADNDAFKVEVVRVIGDGVTVAVHSRYDGFGPVPLVAFDVFRLKDGKIAEHWDNMIAVLPLNPSGRSQLDGAAEVTDLDQTDTDKATIEAFITKSLINHEEVNITDYISPGTYIQHNPAVADGLEGFGAFMGQLAEQGIAMEYTKIHQIIGEGNFVLASPKGRLAVSRKPLTTCSALKTG